MSTPSAATGGALLSVRDLTISKPGPTGPAPLVNQVGFTVDAGEAVAVVGESGSGKSLTTRALVGLLPPELTVTGHAEFAGIPLVGASERSLRGLRGSRISLLMQDPFSMLNPAQTAFTHIAEGLPRRTRGNRRAVRDEVYRRLEEVGIDGPAHAGRYPFELSGGMRQRVALAAALVRDPEVLIADEPTTALDATTQAEVLAMLDRLRQRRRMALILVTHDLGVAFSVCERVVVMYAGGVLERAASTALLAQPEHPYTFGLLRSQVPVTQRLEDLLSIPGQVPPAAAVTDQCAFAARCAWRQPECVRRRPELALSSTGRETACLRIEQIRGSLVVGEPAAGAARPADLAGEPGVEPLLTVRQLTKTYRARGGRRGAAGASALRGVSFEVAAGEAVGLVGESGSGKTSIARSVLGLTTPDSGSITLGGLELSRYAKLGRAQRRGVGALVQIVFQDPYSSLNPARTVGATLREAVGARRDPDAGPDEPAELLAQVGLPASHASRRPAALSGGERQRVAIARAVALRPRLLICDEPVASLDVSVQADILQLLREVSRRYHMSTLFITHDLAVARQMTDRLVVLYRGEVVEQGATATVLDQPAHDYTRRLVSSALAHELGGGRSEGESQPA